MSGYAKVFVSIYDGSLVQNWKALVTFQQFIILCDARGVVDMTIDAISRRTGIPRELISDGVAALESPDPESRSPESDGRRIERLDAHRTWGWRLVNYAHYRRLMSLDERREYKREWMQQDREARQQKQVSKRPVDRRGQAWTDVDDVEPVSVSVSVSKPTTLSRRRTPSASDPQVKAFIDYAFQSFQERFREKLLIDGGKDGATVKRLLQTYPLARLCGLWDLFLASPDPFIARAGYSIGVFKSQVNKLVAARAVPTQELRGLALLQARERERQERQE